MLKVNGRFRGTCCLHLQGEVGDIKSGTTCSSEPPENLHRPAHSVICQKLQLYMSTAIITLNPTKQNFAEKITKTTNSVALSPQANYTD
jgi:hypothetical protein